MLYGNRDSSSIIFLEALAELKDKHLGPASKSIISSTEEEEDIELFNGMLDRAECEEDPGTRDRPGRGRRLVHLRPRADDGRRRRRRCSTAASRRSGSTSSASPPTAPRRGRARDGAAADAGGGRDRRRSRSTAARAASRSRAGNILDSARAAGLPAPFACKAGVCATCRAKVTKGKVEMAARYGLTDEEVAAGYVLTCQSVPLGDGVAVDYDA